MTPCKEKAAIIASSGGQILYQRSVISASPAGGALSLRFIYHRSDRQIKG
jgi:hypothetical protein